MDKRTGKRMVIGAAALALALVVGMRGGSMVQAIAQNRAARTLVIDAGHGGFDGGAVGSSGTSEQDINLSIAQRTDENALGYDPSRSVRENKIADIKAREQFVQETSNPVFLSIHLNKFSDARYHGAQVFYSPSHPDSRALAEQMQETLAEGCDPANNRQAKQAESTIYLMKKLECPAVIVECGFLSNPEEEQRLSDTEYHKKLAASIVTGYLRYESSG